MDTFKQGLDLAAELSKQLVTLSTAILALSITFARPVLRSATLRQRHLIIASWCTYLLVILFALWHLSALAGSLLKMTSPALQVAQVNSPPTLESAKLPAILQIAAFILATLLFVCFAVSSSWSPTVKTATSSGSSEAATPADSSGSERAAG